MLTKLGGIAAIALASMLLSSGALAGGAFDPTFRLNESFSSTEEGAANGLNEACIEVVFDDFKVDGEVTAVSGGCTAFIFYETEFPHKASASALKNNNTGSAKVSQSVFTEVDVGAFDTDDVGPGVCADAFFGSVNFFQEDSEKCKASASMKGTANASPNPDSLQSAKINMNCELGEQGANIDTSGATGTQAPTAAQYAVVTSAFEGRQDVKVDDNGKLKIKQKGVEEASTATPFCD